MSDRYAAHVIEEEKRLDRALCNFCNDATDPYDPVDQWNESVQRNLKELCMAYNAWYRMRLMDPIEREKSDRWADACATASYIMDRLNEARNAGTEHPNMIDSHLQRNIADAIMGTLKQTMADRKAGKRPETMGDALEALVADGKHDDLSVAADAADEIERLRAALTYIRNTASADSHDGWVEFCDAALAHQQTTAGSLLETNAPDTLRKAAKMKTPNVEVGQKPRP